MSVNTKVTEPVGRLTAPLTSGIDGTWWRRPWVEATYGAKHQASRHTVCLNPISPLGRGDEPEGCQLPDHSSSGTVAAKAEKSPRSRMATAASTMAFTATSWCEVIGV